MNICLWPYSPLYNLNNTVPEQDELPASWILEFWSLMARLQRISAEMRTFEVAERDCGIWTNTVLFQMIVGVLTTCHTQYTWDRSICIFLFNRTTLQVFVTYIIGALYVHLLWFCKHQHDNRVRSKLFVAFFFLYFADRASQHIYLNINQLDALNFIMSLLHASTCFEQKCSSLGAQNCTIQHLVSSHL